MYICPDIEVEDIQIVHLDIVGITQDDSSDYVGVTINC